MLLFQQGTTIRQYLKNHYHMCLLNVSGLYKQENGQETLRDVSLTLQHRKTAIAGETGSGKSTLLKIIAGFVQPDAGAVFFDQVRVKGPHEKLIPGHPAIAYLSQHFELRNNYRVEELLQYANKLPIPEAQQLYALCRIDHLLKRRTDQLSGGEKQRIAMARLLIASPRLLLLDEPYSNLDMIHKNILKSVIGDVVERLGVTCLLVSHDPIDTLSWADEIFVLKGGRIVQQGTPEQVYKQPVNAYAAALFGRYHLLDPALAAGLSAVPGRHAGHKSRFARPEDFRLGAAGSPAGMGKVHQVSFLGSHYEVEVRLAGTMIAVKSETGSFAAGDPVYVSLPGANAWYV